MKPKRKERHRSTNLELLGGVGTEALRRMREIATKADLPLSRVFRDVLAVGVTVVTGPESPYQSLIEFRNGLALKQMEDVTPAPTIGEAQVGTPARGGELQALPEFDRLGGSSQPPAIEQRFDDALERSGFEPEAEENSGLSSQD